MPTSITAGLLHFTLETAHIKFEIADRYIIKEINTNQKINTKYQGFVLSDSFITTHEFSKPSITNF
jgi:hypothetical protein